MTPAAIRERRAGLQGWVPATLRVPTAVVAAVAVAVAAATTLAACRRPRGAPAPARPGVVHHADTAPDAAVRTTRSPPPGDASGEAPAQAAIRFVNAADDPRAARVAFYLRQGPDDDILLGTGVSYGAGTPFGAYWPGDLQLVVRRFPAPPTSAPLLVARPVHVDSQGGNTVVLYGSAPTLAVACASQPGPHEVDDPARAGVAFFHAVAGAGALDVCVRGASGSAATPVFAASVAEPATAATTPSATTAVGYGAWAAVPGGAWAWADLPAGRPVGLQLRAASTPPCAGALAGTAQVTLAGGHAWLLVATRRDVLVCDDASADDPADAPTPGCHAAALTLLLRGGP